MTELGLSFDPYFTFVTHIKEIITEAMIILGFIRRSAKDFRGANALVDLYRSLILPTLEYASVV